MSHGGNPTVAPCTHDRGAARLESSALRRVLMPRRATISRPRSLSARAPDSIRGTLVRMIRRALLGCLLLTMACPGPGEEGDSIADGPSDSGSSSAGPTTDGGSTGTAACFDEDPWSTSLMAWQALVAANGESYTYDLQYPWLDIDFPCTVTITTTVVDGTITARAQTVPDPMTCLAGEWTEQGADIGTNQPRGLGAMTMDQVYEYCLTNVLCSEAHPEQGPVESYTLSFDGDGILDECRYFLSCSDACDASDVGAGIDIAGYMFTG